MRALNVMIAPYRMVRTLKLIDCIPVEYPVPTKNTASPKFFNVLNTCEDNGTEDKFFCTTYPAISPTSSVLAVLPMDRCNGGTEILPRMLPSNATKQTSINSENILLSFVL